MNLIKDLNKNLFLKKNNTYSIFVILSIFILDRFSKNKILENFSDNAFFVNEVLNLNLIWNTGIGFGLLSSNSSLIYNLVTVLIGLVILILCYVTITLENTDKLIFSIIIGGAFGNFYDRIFYKAVPDFLDLHYNSFHWFTFNVADIFITLGILGFIVKGFFVKNEK
jgi:signal peptidase II